jgi:hypothetical protein
MYHLHEPSVIQDLFRQRTYQGADPATAAVLFVGLDDLNGVVAPHPITFTIDGKRRPSPPTDHLLKARNDLGSTSRWSGHIISMRCNYEISRNPHPLRAGRSFRFTSYPGCRAEQAA